MEAAGRPEGCWTMARRRLWADWKENTQSWISSTFINIEDTWIE